MKLKTTDEHVIQIAFHRPIMRQNVNSICTKLCFVPTNLFAWKSRKAAASL